jgi:ATP-dependent Lon protease
MEEIGLFPLGLVLLPTEQVPLHIFEPRYRELIRECLDHDREFGLVYSDDEGLRSVGTRAAVVEILEEFGDGRLDIVVAGRERFRLVELTSGRVFQTARVDRIADSLDPADPAVVERALDLFSRLMTLTGAELEAPDPESPQLSFELAACFEFTITLKQELLQSTSERLRLTRLCELLEGAAETLARQQEIGHRAQTNGKVEPRGP